jgi:hypothetical protein
VQGANSVALQCPSVASAKVTFGVGVLSVCPGNRSLARYQDHHAIEGARHALIKLSGRTLCPRRGLRWTFWYGRPVCLA